MNNQRIAESCCVISNIIANCIGFKLLAYAIMPDHFHAIIHVPEWQTISTIMHDLKKVSSIQIGRRINRMGKPIWQQGYYEHVIRDAEDFKTKLDYIHKNPLNACLVENLEDYPFSSYRNYYLNEDSVIEIDKILVQPRKGSSATAMPSGTGGEEIPGYDNTVW